jgi:hypothetical protein
MSKAFVLGFVAGLALLIVAGVGASRLHQKDAGQEKSRAEVAEYQAEIGDATPVRLGVLTPKQRFHSKLHNGSAGDIAGTTISQLMAAYRGQRIVLGRSIDGRMSFPSGDPEAPEDYFGRFAQESDAIIRGRAVSKISQITEDDSFLFTDYDVVVSEVFKNNAIIPLNSGTSITVTCAGGKIVIDDVVMKAGGNGEASLPVNAQDVLLFLKFIPETGSYRLTRYNGGFELNGKSVRPLAGIFPITPSIFNNERSFLKTVKAVSNK